VLFAKTALTTTIVTTVAWVLATFVTKAEKQDVLVAFYRKVHPHVTGWMPIARLAPEIPATRDLRRNLWDWVLGCGMIYLTLFGIGKLALGPRLQGLLFLLGAAVCAALLYVDLRRGWGEEPVLEAPQTATQRIGH